MSVVHRIVDLCSAVAGSINVAAGRIGVTLVVGLRPAVVAADADGVYACITYWIVIDEVGDTELVIKV